MIRVYIASPYTIGDKQKNVNFQIDLAEKLAKEGFLPFWPLHSHYWHKRHPHAYHFWMELDFEEIERSDVLLRQGGESNGADMEVAHAHRMGIPVVYTIEQLIEWAQTYDDRQYDMFCGR